MLLIAGPDIELGLLDHSAPALTPRSDQHSPAMDLVSPNDTMNNRDMLHEVIGDILELLSRHL